ncbi:MAG: HNH endonuclease [Sarcina sp.]
MSDTLNSFYNMLGISNKNCPTGDRSGNRSLKTQSDRRKWFRNVKEIHIHDGTTVKGYSAYLKTNHWKQLRENMIIRSNGRCEDCGTTEGEMNIHHLTYNTLGFENKEDLVVVCIHCHAKRHRK